MDFTLENFDFKVDTLTTVAEIDSQLEVQNLQLQGLKLKLDGTDYSVDKSEFKSGSLEKEIADVQVEIAGKEVEVAGKVPGTAQHETVLIELDRLKIKLRTLNLRKNTTVSPESIVEKNLDNGEAELLLQYFTAYKTALEARKAAL
jgi:hypothetical protein